MSKSEETRQRDECLTEAYGEDVLSEGGACAADVLAGFGREEWAPKAHARLDGHCAPKKTISESNELAGRVSARSKHMAASQQDRTGGRKDNRPSRLTAAPTASRVQKVGHRPHLVQGAAARHRVRRGNPNTTVAGK